jgi:polysaccharide export outer membrane protein
MIYKSQSPSISLSAFLVLILVLLAQTLSTEAQTSPPPNLNPPASTPSTGQPAAASSPQTSPELLIGSGDLLEVSVFGAPDFAKTIRVSAAGDISLPLIGSVKVAGLPILQAEQIIAKSLKDGGFFADPQVSIFEKEYATQGVSVLGEVQKPGIYPLLGSRNLFDAISAAGGTTPRAGNTVTITRRNLPEKPETVPLTYGPGSSKTNVQVMPGDTVAVSKAGIVYVVGDVGKPGGFVMENAEMTVLQAIAMAQGANPAAALNSAKLIRRASNQPQEIPIPLKQILAAKAPDLRLQPDDIVFVPTSAGKTAARKSMEAILQTATGIAIYRR